MNTSPFSRYQLRLTRALWLTDLDALPAWKRVGLRTLRISYAVIRDLMEGQLNLHAMSLVYTTLLSLIPLLAVSFTFFRAFETDGGLEGLLMTYLYPLGAQGVVLGRQIVEAVKGIDYTLLGSIGFLFLIYTVFSMIQKIERAVNFAWHVRHPRRWKQHFSYFGVILFGPLMIFTVFGLTTAAMGTRVATSLREIQTVGFLLGLASQMIPYLLVLATFTFLYTFIPNTKVRLGSALLGAAFAGIFWEISARVFSSIVVTSARYQALVSSFALPLLFMIWLYVSWLILLVGAAIAFYHQHPEFLGFDRVDVRLSNRLQERLGLLLIYWIGKGHYDNLAPLTASELAQRSQLPVDVVTHVLEALERSRLVALTGYKEKTFIPARPFEEVRLREVLHSIRTAEEGPFLNCDRLVHEESVEVLGERIANSVSETLADTTVKEWVLSRAAKDAPS